MSKPFTVINHNKILSKHLMTDDHGCLGTIDNYQLFLLFNHDTEYVAIAIGIARLIIMIDLDGRLCANMHPGS